MDKAKSIVLDDEIQRFIDLGLGRGVDSTKPSPWINKSSFLVRTATFDNVIGTDEGGFLQSYKSTISSASDIQLQLKASVAVPNTPVSLGLEGEISRSTNSSKKVIGKKVTNRTISFRVDHEDPLSEDVPAPETEKMQVASEKDQIDAPAMKKTQVHDSLRSSFEETLSKWILKRINDRAGVNTSEKDPFKGRPVEMLREYLSKASKEEAALVVDDCSEFISSFGVTHYVSSITLGASEHTVMTESDYSRMIKEGFDLSVASVGSVKQKMSTKSKTSKSSTRSQLLGKIVEDKVDRGSNNEAVIGIKILPIHSLIHKNRFLYLSLNKALMGYTEERSLKPTGPYVIECGDEGMYWKIGPNNHLTITEDMEQATVFHVIACEETDDPYDFTIGSHGTTLHQMIEEDYALDASSKSLHQRIMRYLEVKTFFFGHFPGPLKLRSELSAKDARLCLYKQLEDDYFETPADITPWINGQKVYFISSANRKSLIGIYRFRKHGSEEIDHIAKCVNSQELHDEKSIWMLFRLLPADICIDYCKCQKMKERVIASFSSERPKAKVSEELSKLLESSAEHESQ